MRRQRLLVLIASVVVITSFVQASVAEKPAIPPIATGTKVMPKLGAVVRSGNQIVDGDSVPLNRRLTLPWIVQGIDGQWVLVGDDRKGWVERSQVVALDAAPEYYTPFVNSGSQRRRAFSLRAVALDQMGDPKRAIADHDQKIRLSPTAAAHNNRGIAWSDMKQYDKAMADYQRAMQLDPNYALGFNSAAWMQATCPDDGHRDGRQAVKLATRACELTGWTEPYILGTLGAAYAELGDFASAIKYQQRSIESMAVGAPYSSGAQDRLAMYRAGKPYRQER